MNTLLKQRIVVLGGFGEFNRRIAAAVAAIPQVECVLGLPPGVRAAAFAQDIGVPFVVLEPNDPLSLQRLLEGAFAAVNVGGPFTGRDQLAVAARCAALGVHYVDPADTRAYIADFGHLARAAQEHRTLLVTGAGAAPAVTAALAELLRTEFDRINEIDIFVTPGLNDQRELATVSAVLEQSAGPLRMKEGGRWRERHWWERARTVRCPQPIGWRRGYLCDLPDVELFARQFGAGTISARTGFAPGPLSLLLSGLALLRRRQPAQRLSPMLRLLVRTAARAARPHSGAAAIRIAMRGSRRGVEAEHVACLVARNGAGPAIAAAPMLTLIRRWVQQGVTQTGALPCIGLLNFDDLKPELAQHQIVLVRE